MLEKKHIILGISGGIAAYKAVEILRELTRLGASVEVVMTQNAKNFITPLTFQTLSGNPVYSEMFTLLKQFEIPHVSLADKAHLVLIAPATANLIGKMAGGIADDLLSTLILAATSPILVAPAMNPNMYENPIVQSNLKRLKELGYGIIEPEEGMTACGWEGKGRLAETEVIIEEIRVALAKKDLKGKKILVTAGPTEEDIDPIRFISNRSSGKMGYVLAKVARRRGGEVTLVSGPTHLPIPKGVRFIGVKRAVEMAEAVLKNYEDFSIIVKAAAVADWRPKEMMEEKIRESKGPFTLELVSNPDILFELGQRKGERILVGFAAETQDLVSNAQKKLKTKNLDLIVANDVTKEGAGFGYDTNQVKIIDREGNMEELPLMNKEEVAERVWDRVARIKG